MLGVWDFIDSSTPKQLAIFPGNPATGGTDLALRRSRYAGEDQVFSGAVLFSLLMYSKPYLKLATLPCRLGIQAGLKWLSDIKKTSGRRYNSCLPKKRKLVHPPV